jgi:hypothetical protein
VTDEQGNVAIVGKLAYGVDQGIGAGVVEKIGDLHPVRVELIIQFEQVECLPGARSARAQHGIDCDALVPQVVPDLDRVPLAVRGETSLAIFAARSYVFGLRMAEYEQRASLVHPYSLRSRLPGWPPARTVQQQSPLPLVLGHGGRPGKLRPCLLMPSELVQQITAHTGQQVIAAQRW